MIKRKFTVKEIKNYLSWITESHPHFKIDDIINNISEFDLEEANANIEEYDEDWHNSDEIDNGDDYDDRDWDDDYNIRKNK